MKKPVVVSIQYQGFLTSASPLVQNTSLLEAEQRISDVKLIKITKTLCF